RENSVSETPFLTVKTTGETPVPQFCHGLLSQNLLWHGPPACDETPTPAPVPQVLQHALSSS
ncbi:MAG: hypothetical protein JXQ75_13050, partial [Phycisphaerae bacterium]|nr:hypothetical protein [Phycisphaerae bacterium]